MIMSVAFSELCIVMYVILFGSFSLIRQVLSTKESLGMRLWTYFLGVKLIHVLLYMNQLTSCMLIITVNTGTGVGK